MTGTDPCGFPVFTPLISFGSRKNCYLALVSPSSPGASLSSWGPFSWAPLHVELEREAHTRGQLVGIVRVTPRVYAIDKLRGSQCRTCEQVGAFEVERRVRREPPREPKVRLGPDVAGVALDPAPIGYGRPAGRARPQTRRGTRAGADLRRRPRGNADAHN